MALLEAKLMSEGKRFINMELAPLMPVWTFESIKSNRKSPEYKALVKSIINAEKGVPTPHVVDENNSNDGATVHL